MRSSFPLEASRYWQGVFSVLCVSAVLLVTVSTYAQTPAAPDQDDDESTASAVQTDSNPVRSDHRESPKKLEKYDVSRIGHRGIGRGFNLYSLKSEHELGLSLAASFDHSSRRVNDPTLNAYVNDIAQKIVRNSDAEVPFTVRLIDSGEIPRAYGLPGGFLYVDSALVFAAESEAELAGIMAHEIAHVAARHATRALTRKRLFSATGSLSLLAGPAGVVLEDAGSVAGPLSLKKFCRDSEFEADLLGIEYAYSAGYDPQALLSALEKLHAMEAARTSAFAKVPGYHLVSHLPFHDKVALGFSNYPLMEDRIRRLQSEIATFLPARRHYIIDTNEFQEIKAHLLTLQGPIQLHRHGDDENPNAPVLRRTPPAAEEPASGNLRNAFTILPVH